MSLTDENRRRFLGYFSGAGLGATLLPGVLWGQMQQEGAQAVTPEMLAGALGVAGLKFSEEDQRAMLQAANRTSPATRNCATCIFRTTSHRRFTSAPSPGDEGESHAEPFRFSTPR